MTWPHRVTLWRRQDDESYERQILRHCLWQDRRGAQLRKTGSTSDNGVLVFLPAGVTVKPGDRILKGEYMSEVTRGSELDKLGALLITAVDSYDYGKQHIEVTCR